jgi:hypothetical protein
VLMFSESFQETLARYSDPSQNPYVQVRSQVRALPCLKKYTDILGFSRRLSRVRRGIWSKRYILD